MYVLVANDGKGEVLTKPGWNHFRSDDPGFIWFDTIGEAEEYRQNHELKSFAVKEYRDGRIRD